jgi:uncharacterized damage-inducible protein DinB
VAQSNKWEHFILRGEFPIRKKIIQGLTAEQVNQKPVDGMHSIYEELWHITRWAHIVINQDAEAEKEFKGDGVFPKEPATREEWNRLVNEFCGLLDKMMEITKTADLNKEQEDGWTLQDYVHSLIMHSSYHLGKIVAVRQMIGAWDPELGKK